MQYLDMMVRNRCNVLDIWSGHPFASLVKVPEYPEALEVSEEGAGGSTMTPLCG